jgi:hypothetical protein
MLSRSFVISSRLSLLDLCAEPLFLLAEFRRELCAEILGFEHLPNLKLASFVRGIGTTLGPIDRLLQRRAFQSQKPATSSLVSANGPSITVRLSPKNLTRAPFELG